MTVDSITQQQSWFSQNLPPNNEMFTREQLIKIREQSRRQPIHRVLRKTLFEYNIWRPSVFPVPDEKCNKDKSSTGTKCAVLNSRSINNKEDSIYELIVDNCLDFLALTETWCNENSTVSNGQITPPGYFVIHTHIPTRGGGVALIIRDTYKAKRVKCAVLNSRSINNKVDSIYELIVDNCLDFLALTETWCNENSTVSNGQITPPGYFVIHTHIPTRGGGVALIIRDTYNAKRVKTGKYTNFDNQTVSLSLGTNYLHVTTIYIPSGIFSSEFNEQISDLLS